MKRFNSVLFFAFLIGGSNAFALNTSHTLKHPLIVGASISYGYEPITGGVQPDPVTILATRYGRQAGIIKHAVPGETSAQTLALVQPSDLDVATISIGIDLFFWDSLLSWADCDAAVARVQQVYDSVTAKNIPWILGRIPNLGLQQSCMNALNQKIDQLCTGDAKCRLIDFPKIVQTMKSNGGLVIDGHFYTSTEIQPDGIHLSAGASQWVADLLDQAITGKFNSYIVYGTPGSRNERRQNSHHN